MSDDLRPTPIPFEQLTCKACRDWRLPVEGPELKPESVVEFLREHRACEVYAVVLIRCSWAPTTRAGGFVPRTLGDAIRGARTDRGTPDAVSLALLDLVVMADLLPSRQG